MSTETLDTPVATPPATTAVPPHPMQGILLILAGLYLLSFVVVALLRLRYPYELEWMEGGTIDHVRRILSGEKLYAAPSLEFTAFIYPPLYYYLGALFSKVLGVGFLPLRLISLLATLGSCAFLYLLVLRETKNRAAGFIAAGLFAAMFKLSGYWYDLSRVDSLFVCFLLAGFYVLRARSGIGSRILAASLFTLALFTKQSGLLTVLPLLLYLPYRERKDGLAFAGAFIAFAGLGTLLLNQYFDGWYLYYTFTIPQHHDLQLGRLRGFWWADTGWIYIAILLSGLYLFLRPHGESEASRRTREFYLVLTIGMVGMSWFSRIHTGSFKNVIIPALAAFALLSGLALHHLLFAPAGEERKASGLLRNPLLIIGAFAVQFVALAYNPLHQLPTPRARLANEQLQASVANEEGEVWILQHPYMAANTGRPTYAHAMAIFDIIRADRGAPAAKLKEEIVQAVQAKRFKAIYYDFGYIFANKEFDKILQENYTKAHDVKAPAPVIGANIHTRSVYTPKPKR